MHMHAIPLNDGEEVLVVIRRHWFHIALRAVADIVVFFVFTVGVIVFDGVLLASHVGAVGSGIALSIYLLAVFGLFLWMHFFAAWSDHWLDAWIITNKRIIDIEQKGFFARQVSSFPIERIQDVTYDVSGVIAMWLHFGDVRIQTASITDNLVMRQVPFPEEVKEAIMQAVSAGNS